MQNVCSNQQICLMNQIRKLWSQHVYWTRFFIISTAAELFDLESVTNRLLQNPNDFAQMLEPFYGREAANRFRVLLTEHIQIGGELVNASKNRNQEAADRARKKWYANSDEIAKFLACLNPHWCKSKWKNMLYDHLEMTEKEASLRLQGCYGKDIEIFDKIESEALMMADYMFCGIINQF